jgi:hypothetical protein
VGQVDSPSPLRGVRQEGRGLLVKIVELRNQHLAVQKQPGKPGADDVWRIVLTDKDTGDSMWLAFDRGTKDEMVRELTGVVLPNGDTPKL